jgi:hypothetical protein
MHHQLRATKVLEVAEAAVVVEAMVIEAAERSAPEVAEVVPLEVVSNHTHLLRNKNE